MSNEVFPDLPGLDIRTGKAPVWKTKIQESVSGKEQRGSFMAYPIWHFELRFTFLRSDVAFSELQSLVGFFNRHRGQFDSFLYPDPEDNAVVAQQFGVGDGASTAFQLTRAWGNFVEPVQNLNGAPQIYIAGVLKSSPVDYSVSSLGVVTFTSPPGNGLALTWSGGYYFRLRFRHDELQSDRLLERIWETRRVSLRSIKL